MERIETTSTRLPVQNATKSFWRRVPHKLDNHQSVEKLPAHCDVIIIGSGYAGVATAYHLLKSAPATNVVMLEAREVCSGATGRNGGHLRPDYTSLSARFCERYGSEAASAVVRFEKAHIGAIKQLIEEEGIDCDFAETKSFDVFTTVEEAAAARAKYDMLCAQPTFTSLMADVEFYEGDNAPERTGVTDAKAYFSVPAAHLWPYKLITALLSRAIELGLCLKTKTPVLSIKQDVISKPDSKVIHRITTPNGEITANTIIMATNAYTSALLPEYAAAIVPCKGLVCHISHGEDATLPPLKTSSFCLRLNHGRLPAYNYLIQRTDGTIVVGGAHHTYKPDTGSWYGNVDDSTLIKPARDYYDDFMNRTFSGWEDVKANIDCSWTGIMAYSADSLPHVGPVPDREGVFILAGFNGHGMPVIYLAAKSVAEMICEEKTYEQTGLPPPYLSSPERLNPRFDDILGTKV
ncbi:putative oxidoreductase OrdL-like protein [Cladobotryum mycophilum]|uniref:Oxidoreductase OrdL-like protein n=1 Tax=Cladobotryum mycophilum TaxID=491253 RepID=A0ABR0SJB6_9HYPO